MSSDTQPLSRVHSVGKIHTRSWLYEVALRLFNLFWSSLGLLLLWPLFLYIAWRIKRDTPGPVFYRATRLGKGECPFQMLKFRTMHEDKESENGPRLTTGDDPRVTPYGRFLRDSKLNELPQLWNVFKGEMNLVGPRPEDPEVAAKWPAELRAEICSVHPGMTGASSVRYRDEASLLDNERLMDSYLTEILPSKLRLDLLYVRHRSLWIDLDILFWTLLVLIPQLETYQPSDKRLFTGPIYRLTGRYFNWFLVDLCVVFVAVALTGLLWRSFGPLDVGLRTAFLFALGFAFLCSLLGYLFGVQRVYWSEAAAHEVFDLLLVIILATIITLFGNHFLLSRDPGDPYRAILAFHTGQPLFPTSMILVAAGLALLGFVVVRYRARLVTGLATRWINLRGTSGTPKERVLIVGGGQTGHFASWLVGEGYYADSFQVQGIVDDDLFKQDTRIRGLEVLGQRADIPQLVKDHDIGLIIFAIHNIRPSARKDVLEICRATPARVVVFPDIPASLNGQTRDSESSAHPEESLQPIELPPNLSPESLDQWLDELETMASNRDFTALHTHIQHLRRQINTDTGDVQKSTL